jgi:membrane fusion protein, heavy metal efflux system
MKNCSNKSAGCLLARIRPVSAIQYIGQAQVVFVSIADGFEKRTVRIGQSDDNRVEILSGVAAGEMIAVTKSPSG